MFSPLQENSWTRYSAAHLLNRAGFGGTPAEIDRLHELGPEKAVASFLEADEDSDLFPPPLLMDPAARFSFYQRIKASPNEEERKALKKEFDRTDREEILNLRIWWLNRMRYTADPLVEKATLFWHSHFATSNTKVRDAYSMWQQNETIRRHALGKFPSMLKEISRDPAMIKWLDLNQSRKGHPNENFAREVMELFSVGEGNYSEKDIQEAARAFTGYRIDRNGMFRLETKDYDSGVKTFFGKTGTFSGDDIIDMIVAMPQCARYIGRKLWTFFVSENPSEETISKMADLLLGNGYDIGATLRVIMESGEFYQPKVVRHQIKSPVEWMIQTTKMLEIPLPDTLVMDNALSILGQVLFAPPNVKGWDGGRAWISASTLLYRYNLAAYLLSGKARILGGGKGVTARVPLDKIVSSGERASRMTLLDHLEFRVFNAPVTEKENAAYFTFLGNHQAPYSDQTILDFIQTMMSSPSYQLN
jgi:hypothetical protein